MTAVFFVRFMLPGHALSLDTNTKQTYNKEENHTKPQIAC